MSPSFISAANQAPGKPDGIARLQGWLRTPRAPHDSDEYANQLQHLQALGECAATLPQRMAVLDALYLRLHAALDGTAATLTTLPLPLPRKQKLTLRAAQDCLLNLARALLGSLSEHSPRHGLGVHFAHNLGHPPELVLWRALRCLGRHFQLSALVAAPAGHDLWRELHHVFQRAQALDLLDTHPDPDGQSLADTYFATILHACAQPTSLSVEENRCVADLLAHSRGLIDPEGESPPTFILDLARDAPAFSAFRPPPDLAIPFAFSCKRLCARLRVQEAALTRGIGARALELPGFAETPSGRSLLRRLASRWNSPAKRRFPRRRQGYRGQLLAGLDALRELFRHAANHPPPSTQWMIINESPDGYAAMHVSGDTGNFAAGDIAALRTETGDRWQLCIVRRVESAHPEHIEVGLQILPGDAAPASLIRPASSDTPTERHAVLLLPPIPPLRNSALLVAPNHALPDAPCEFLLVTERHNLEIREMRSLGCEERNARIALFHIENDQPPAL